MSKPSHRTPARAHRGEFLRGVRDGRPQPQGSFSLSVRLVLVDFSFDGRDSEDALKTDPQNSVFQSLGSATWTGREH